MATYSGSFPDQSYSAYHPWYTLPDISTSGEFTTYTVTGTVHVDPSSAAHQLNVGCGVYDLHDTLLNSSLPQSEGVSDGGTFSFTVPGPGGLGAFDGTQADHFKVSLSAWDLPHVNGWASFTITWDAAGPACPYGAERNPDAGTYSLLSEDLWLIICGLMGWGPLVITAYSAVVGSPLVVPVCDYVPPLPPALLESDLIPGTAIPKPGSLGKFGENLKYGAWKFYCQCKPNPSTGVRPPPPPNPPVPPVMQPGPQPKITCDPTNPCETFNYIVNILAQIQTSISYNRYAPPMMKYQTGTRHVGLSGDGQFSVSGILGVVAQFTTLPPRVGVSIGDPNRIWDVGWINVGTDDGWHTRAWMTANPWMFYPPDMPNMTQIGYSVPADVVVDLVELVPAP